MVSPPHTVLIVEDNPLNLKLLRVTLMSEGYNVQTATDAREATEVLSGELPELILMDIQLPEVDGLTLTRRIKAEPRTGHIPIIAVTAYAMQSDRVKALEAGCTAFLAKPLDIDTLLGLIDRHLSQESAT